MHLPDDLELLLLNAMVSPEKIEKLESLPDLWPDVCAQLLSGRWSVETWIETKWRERNP